MIVAWPKLLAAETERGRWIPMDGHEKQLRDEIIRPGVYWMRNQPIYSSPNLGKHKEVASRR